MTGGGGRKPAKLEGTGGFDDPGGNVGGNAEDVAMGGGGWAWKGDG